MWGLLTAGTTMPPPNGAKKAAHFQACGHDPTVSLTSWSAAVQVKHSEPLGHRNFSFAAGEAQIHRLRRLALLFRLAPCLQIAGRETVNAQDAAWCE